MINIHQPFNPTMYTYDVSLGALRDHTFADKNVPHILAQLCAIKVLNEPSGRPTTTTSPRAVFRQWDG